MDVEAEELARIISENDVPVAEYVFGGIGHVHYVGVDFAAHRQLRTRPARDNHKARRFKRSQRKANK